MEAQAERSPLARRVLLPVQEFFHTERTGAVLLLFAAVAALAWANSPWRASYESVWQVQVGLDLGGARLVEDVRHWVNDGLMALFFYVVGLEIKHELLRGSLSSARRAALPAAAALGGMVAPAALYLGFNAGSAGARGWGVPMATDIAFAVGVLALLGSRIPGQVRSFLLALAIVDDIGAILVIAIFYTEHLSLPSLGLAALLAGAIWTLTRLRLRMVPVYVLLAALLWLAVFESGVHATLAGVVLAALTPTVASYSRQQLDREVGQVARELKLADAEGHRDRADALLGRLAEIAQGTEAPLHRLERLLHPWTSYLVLPLFALANAGVQVSGGTLAEAILSPIVLGIVVGLVVGKPIGISLAAWLTVRFGLAALPAGMSYRMLVGVGVVAGIGFTVSLFIAGLAFDGARLELAKTGILGASSLAGMAGYVLLRCVTRGPAMRKGAASR